MEDLGNSWNGLGRRSTGAGTATVTVEGKAKLHGARHKVIFDRIEAGTFLLACAAARAGA